MYCAIPGCTENARMEMYGSDVMCLTHWRMVPNEIKRELFNHEKRPNLYVQTLESAIKHVVQKERRKHAQSTT